MGCILAQELPPPETVPERSISSACTSEKKVPSDPDLEPPKLQVSTAVGRNVSLRVLRRREERLHNRERCMYNRNQSLGRWVVPLEEFDGRGYSEQAETCHSEDLRNTQQLSEVRAFEGAGLAGLSRSDE